MIPRVLNKRTATAKELAGAVYVGRPSKWGNPFVIGRDGAREQVVARYRDWLRWSLVGLAPILCRAARTELRGKHLVCWCAPLPCHADVLLEIANAD